MKANLKWIKFKARESLLMVMVITMRASSARGGCKGKENS